MYRLRYQIGGVVPLLICTTDANGVPTIPDVAPQARVFNGAGQLVASFQLAIVDRYIQPGLFYGYLYLADPIVPAAATNTIWTVTYSWSIGSYTGHAHDTFDVLNLGSQFGNVISMYYYRRPDADYIIWQSDSGPVSNETGADGQQHIGGQIFSGRNPHL